MLSEWFERTQCVSLHVMVILWLVSTNSLWDEFDTFALWSLLYGTPVLFLCFLMPVQYWKIQYTSLTAEVSLPCLSHKTCDCGT